MPVRILKCFAFSMSIFASLANAQFFEEEQVADADFFTAASLIPLTNLHFGEIALDIGSRCTLDINANVTGDCNVSNADISIGEFEVSGLQKNSNIFVTISGSQSPFLGLTVAGQTSLNGNRKQLTDSIPAEIRVRGNKDLLYIRVFGDLEVNAKLFPREQYQVSYTVDIMFQ